MGSDKKRRRVVRLSMLERIVLVAVIGLVAYVGWDVYQRYWGGPGVGGLASRVYAPGGQAAPAVGRAKASTRAVPPKPQPPPDNPYAWHPPTYLPPSGSPAASGAPGPAPSRAAGGAAAPPAAPGPADEVRFPTWSDADPSLMSPAPR